MLSIDETKFTPTELRILRLLNDGRPHLRDDIHKECFDSLTDIGVVSNNISRIRKQVRRVGQDVVCTLVGGRVNYQHVILLPPE